MALALAPVQVVTASKYLAGATDVTLRKRLLLGWLDKAGRINRNATGKDLNWLLKFKNAEASPYLPYQSLSFTNDNYHVALSLTPEWWHTTSGMDITELLTNSGPTAIVNTFEDRYDELAQAMEIKLAKSLYLDGNSAAGSGLPIGIGTFAAGYTTCSTSDQLAIPSSSAGIYGGISIGLGSQGGTWSNNIPTASQMNTSLGNDWPDGQGDPSNAYDATSPRLYNEKTSRWNSAGSSNWRDNCVAMLSRANTDLKMNSVETMMPSVHVMGGARYQAVKDKMRESFRDLKEHTESVDLGYYDTLSFEGAALSMDHECPGDRTYSLCAGAMDAQFFGAPDKAKQVEAGAGDGQMVTGGIFTAFGPERPPHMAQWVWIMFAGGNFRYSPKWIVVHKDFTV